jgi:molybdopterin synthase catalytic subunit
MAAISNGSISLDALLTETEDAECGALVVFGGTVRRHNHGREVVDIAYSAHGPLAEKTLAEIEAETLEKFDARHCRLVHRVGELAVGDVSVYAVVRAVHRGEAFEAARYAVEALKHRVAIWKHERYSDGSSAHLEGCSLVSHHEAEEQGHGA